MIRITETARDAMQGIKTPISTEHKVQYINALLQVGFTTLDTGSFVSPRTIPQMADTGKVLDQLVFPAQRPEIMVLVVNKRGVEQALQYSQVNCISYPFSVSPTFLRRNLNTDEKGSLHTLKEIMDMAHGRLDAVIYLSMGLGNPYGDDWSVGMVQEKAGLLYELGVRRMPLSDILGDATPDKIHCVYETIIPAFPDVDFGLHLHTRPSLSYTKLEAAWEAGVRSYETVMNGLGGCPTAADEMVGNLSTQDLMFFCQNKGIPHGLNSEALYEAAVLASGII
jgi:hydroxymethylglutaryl-CoA lyase